MSRSFIFCGCVAAALLCAAVVSAQDSWEYGIVIDAGSSHSALYVYKWAPRVSNTYDSSAPFSSPVTQEAWSTANQIAISSFVNNPSAAGASLTPLIAFAQQTLAAVPSQWATTPIYLGATAGMRMLSVASREAIMQSVRTFLGDPTLCGFQFTDPSQARVISGEEEGVFGWITVNYVCCVVLLDLFAASHFGILFVFLGSGQFRSTAAFR